LTKGNQDVEELFVVILSLIGLMELVLSENLSLWLLLCIRVTGRVRPANQTTVMSCVDTPTGWWPSYNSYAICKSSASLIVITVTPPWVTHSARRNSPTSSCHVLLLFGPNCSYMTFSVYKLNALF